MGDQADPTDNRGVSSTTATKSRVDASSTPEPDIINSNGERHVLFPARIEPYWEQIPEPYWCSLDQIDDIMARQWTDYYLSHPDYHPSYSPCSRHAVVLTSAESDIRIGGLSLLELQNHLASYWGTTTATRVRTDFGDGYDDWLEYFIAKNHTFGLVYAWFAAVRSFLPIMSWDNGRLSNFMKWRPSWDVENAELIHGVRAPPFNRNVIQDGRGLQYLRSDGHHRCPRRIWDICANRVIPLAWFGCNFGRAPMEWGPIPYILPVSHAWAAGNDMSFLVTEVNQKLWPVPLPTGVQIEGIRKELIRRRVRYAWIDVLCLRQVACPSWIDPPIDVGVGEKVISARDKQRLQEWETDVPSIGGVYRWMDTKSDVIFVYLNGLGRQLKVEEFGPQAWGDDRNWINRVWTAQETSEASSMMFAGLPDPSKRSELMLSQIKPIAMNLQDLSSRFTEKVRSGIHVPSGGPHLLPGKEGLRWVLYEINRRGASNPVDRIMGLVFWLRHPPTTGGDVWNYNTPDLLPVYDPAEPLEDAWARVVAWVARLSPGCIAKCCHNNYTPTIQLLIIFPHPSREHWFPSWAQVEAYTKNIYIQEPQLEYGIMPSRDYSMRLLYGHVYRNCTITQTEQVPSDNEHVEYLVTSRDPRGNPVTATLSATTPGKPGIVSLDLDRKYVLVDITHLVDTGFRDPINMERDRWETRRPLWDTHFVILCVEVQDEQPPVPEQKGKYYLRRVTTLKWEAQVPYEVWIKEFNGEEGISKEGVLWLPFKLDIASKWYSREEESEARRRTGEGPYAGEYLLWDAHEEFEVYLL